MKIKNLTLENRIDKEFPGSFYFCSCYEGDYNNRWPKAKKRLKTFIRKEVEKANKIGAMSVLQELLLEQYNNDLACKSYDFYFAIRMKLEKYIK